MGEDWAQKDMTRQVLAEVERERLHQIETGWNKMHDRIWNQQGELRLAALCLTDPHPEFSVLGVPYRWPLHMCRWRPKDTRTNLIKAMALLVAEVERLDHETNRKPNADQTNLHQQP